MSELGMRLVLFSGGLDSTVCIASALTAQEPVSAIWIDYGQEARKREKVAVRRITGYYQVRLFEARIRFGYPLPQLRSAYMPARNLMLLATARQLIPESGGSLVLGSTATDTFPDSSEHYIAAAQDLMRIEDGGPFEVKTPLRRFNKSEIMRLALSLGAPVWSTWSCYRNGRYHCGSCGGCRSRQLAFEHMKVILNGAETEGR